VPDYHCDPKLRFNFQNKIFRIPQSKMKRMLDVLMEEKKKIPSPDKYSCNSHTDNLRGYNPKNTHLLYKNDRISSIDIVIKKAKDTPGVSKYNAT
jgi:hypothetical protein